MKNYIKQFFYLLDTQARKTIPILILSFLLSSILDMLGVGLIGLFLGLITNPNFLVNKISFIHVTLPLVVGKKILIISGILIISAFAIKALIVLSIQKKLILFCQSLAVRLKKRLMTAFQYAPYVYHMQKNSDYLISRIQGNIDSYVNNILMAILYLVSNFLIAIFIIALLIIFNPISTITLIVAFILLGLTYDLFAKKQLLAMGKKLAVTNGEITKSVRQGLYGLTEARVLGREKYFVHKLEKTSLEHANAYSIVMARQLLPRYLVENLMAIFIVVISIVCVTAGYSSVNVVAMVGMFAAAGARLLPTFTQIITSVNQIRGYFYQMGLVYEELIEVDELPKNHLESKDTKKLIFSTICLQNVSYFYPNSTLSALEKINIEIIKGQSIGLIGRSGAGKSTLVNLILGFLEPQQGQLLVDDKPITHLRQWLNNFAYIPQSIFLLDDTLRKNIAFGIEETEINEARVLNAIQMAQLTEVVNRLPQGTNTLIGENGVRLSGGQRQRVALARAFYHERDIIIMDEATSSLDNETEIEVINTIKRLKSGKTLIVIAHRLSTVEHCDVLYKLDQGKIIAKGTFKEVVNPIID